MNENSAECTALSKYTNEMSAYQKHGITMGKLPKCLYVIKRWTILDMCIPNSTKDAENAEKTEGSFTSDE